MGSRRSEPLRPSFDSQIVAPNTFLESPRPSSLLSNLPQLQRHLWMLEQLAGHFVSLRTIWSYEFFLDLLQVLESPRHYPRRQTLASLRHYQDAAKTAWWLGIEPRLVQHHRQGG